MKHTKVVDISPPIEDKPSRIIPCSNGYQLILQQGESTDCIEIKTPNGKHSLNILLDEAGAHVQLPNTEISIEAVDTLTLKAQKISIDSHTTTLKSTGPIQITADSNIDICARKEASFVAKLLRLN